MRLLILTLIITACGARDEASSPLGYTLSPDLLEADDWVPQHGGLDDKMLHGYIRERMAAKYAQKTPSEELERAHEVYYHNEEYTRRLATNLFIVARGFTLDPALFAALISWESDGFYASSVSHTQAAGLSQMTTQGIAEVHDQLGRTKRATNGYFQEQTRALVQVVNQYGTSMQPVDPEYPCCGPEGYHDQMEPWKNLWSEDTASVKSFLKARPVYALTYGAILLKTCLVSRKMAISRQNARSAGSKKLESSQTEVYLDAMADCFNASTKAERRAIRTNVPKELEKILAKRPVR